MKEPASGSADCAATEVIGTMLLMGIAVGLVAVFAVILFAIPPPTPEPHAHVEAYVLPRAPDTLVLEHRGGRALPLAHLRAVVEVGGVVASANLEDRLRAGDPAWRVVGTDGSARGVGGSFVAGDRILHQRADLPGASLAVQLIDDRDRASVLGAVAIQPADAAGPVLVAARTTTRTSVELSFSEPLAAVDAADFTFDGGISAVSARLVGNGSRALVTTTAFASSATPTVTTAATPAGTRDVAGNALAAAVAVVAADGVAPAISGLSAQTPSVTNAEIVWTTDEAATTVVRFGPTEGLGRRVNGGVGTSHSGVLEDLTELTLYFFEVESADPSGNMARSTLQTFITADDSGSTSGGGGGDQEGMDLTVQPVTAGVVTQGFSVTIRDKNGNSRNARDDIQVYLQTNSTAGQFYNTAGAPIRWLTIPKGTTSASFGYADTRAGTATVTVAARGMTGHLKPVAVEEGERAGWRLVANGTRAAGAEFAATIEAVDRWGNLDDDYAVGTSFRFSGAENAGANAPRAGVLAADTVFGATTGPFAFAGGRATVRLQLPAAGAAHLVATDVVAGRPSPPAHVDVAPGPLAALVLVPTDPALAAGLWAGPLQVEARDAWGNAIRQTAPLTVGLASPGATFAPTPGAAPAATATIPAGGTSATFYARWATAGTRPFTASAGAVATAGTVFVDVSTAPKHLEFTAGPGTVDSGVVSGPLTITLKDASGSAVAPGAALTIHLATNSTRGWFLDATGGTIVTAVTLGAADTSVQLRYVDHRRDDAPSVITAYATAVVPAAHVVQVEGRGGGGATASGVAVHLVHPAMQIKNEANRYLAVTIVNPTASARTIDWVRFSVSPSLGTFFNAPAVAPGSDAAFACTPVAGAAETTCDPASGVTLPAFGMRQLVLTYSTPNGEGQTVLTATVRFTSGPDATASSNVRLVGNGAVDVLPLSAPGGSVRAGWVDVLGGAPADLYLQWRFNTGTGNVLTRLTIPAGWKNVVVPAQASLSGVSVGVRQPTIDQPGYVLFSQAYGGTPREIFVRATPPDVDGVDALGLEVTDTTGAHVTVAALGVSIR